jgi:ACS family hexuronate transporter-like MFS transporter
MMLVSVISYLDRNTLALLAPTILAETRLSIEQYGLVVSAFSVAYMVGNPVWGRVLDRVGLRIGMMLAVSLWTLASAAHALAFTFAAFAIARAALGFGEGATFPGALRTVVQTLPVSKRSRGVALAYSGGSLGAIITPIVVTPIALWFGWRGAFIFTGIVGVVWLLLWLAVSRRRDVRTAPPRETGPAARPSLRDPRMWSFISAYALGALPLALVLYGASIFLNRVHGASQETIGKVLWIPPLGWEVGYFFWGWISDRAGSRAFRGVMPILALLSLSLALTARVDSFAAALALMFLGTFVAAGFIILAIAYATYVFSASHAGLIAGLGAGSWSALVAVTMPVFGRLMDSGRFDHAFALAAVFPVVGFAGAVILDRAAAARHRLAKSA